tara:strand:- start:2924 stop:3175 length:252 start_codon:yes stop_codon:yes gene_type:complete
MAKMFNRKSWNEKTELERFQTIVDEVYELVWGLPRRPEVKFEGMMTKEKPKRARGKKGRYKADDPTTKDYNEAWVGGKSPKKK